ncbi:NEDD4 family-interacting protein 1-like [Haliotis cracherodii]|uniref:NEDD4 family-interacting protein 1-like n=1 Tax=Haliotis rufescens TaxID=6454 RepID=UPI001EAFD532|nr:NEDD4 family-interacting protein 1-like [Haliotis rufescens]
MERNVRYEVLVGEEEQLPAQPVAMAMVIPPPPYQENTVSQSDPAVYGETKLPSYVDATTLPSYEEAERTKQEEIQRLDEEGQRDPTQDRFTDMTIGTDGMFICTFVIAFLFNWIGFLLSLCISNTVAGRCGALAGLGLSIVKWVAIVKHNNWAQDFASGDSWLWWILVICGFLLFIRGSIQYVRVKYEWNRVAGHIRQYRLI